MAVEWRYQIQQFTDKKIGTLENGRLMEVGRLIGGRLKEVGLYWPTIFNYTMRSLIDLRLKEQTWSQNSQIELQKRAHARTFCTKLRSCGSDWSIVLFLSCCLSRLSR